MTRIALQSTKPAAGSDAETVALEQSFGSFGKPPGCASAADAAETVALEQSFGGRRELSRSASALRDAETIALEQSFGRRGRAEGSAASTGGDRALDTPSDGPSHGRSEAARATVNAAVMKAAEVSKGHKATAAFILTTRASADPGLRDALLAGNGETGRQTVSQIADAEVAAFLGGGEEPAR